MKKLDVFDLVEQFIDECLDSYNEERETCAVSVAFRQVNDAHTVAGITLYAWNNVLHFYRHLAYYTTQHPNVVIIHSGLKSGTFRVKIFTNATDLDIWGLT